MTAGSSVTDSVTGTGTYTQTAGSLAVDGTVTQSALTFTGGVVCGTGTINGSPASSNSRWIPGSCSPLGTLTIHGDLHFNSGVLEIDVTGLGPGQFGVLDVTGAATFGGGTIEFDFLGGFVPEPGDSIPFLLAGSVSGLDRMAFTALGLPLGFTFDVQPGGGGLEFIPGLPSSGVPEPGTLGLVLAGLTALALRRARRA